MSKPPKGYPLKKCCNGCDKPPKAPSWVLCEDCLNVLDKKIHALGQPRPQ